MDSGGLLEANLVGIGLLGVDEISEDAGVCGVPVSWQIERLAQTLDERGFTDVRISSVDLTGLDGVERHAALDAIVADVPSPYVLIGGRLVCTGSVDTEAVVAALIAQG